MIILLFDPHKLDINDEFKKMIRNAWFHGGFGKPSNFSLPTYKWFVSSMKDSSLLHWLQMRMSYALHGVSGLWLSSLSCLLIKAIFGSHHSYDMIMSAKIILITKFSNQN